MSTEESMLEKVREQVSALRLGRYFDRVEVSSTSPGVVYVRFYLTDKVPEPSIEDARFSFVRGRVRELLEEADHLDAVDVQDTIDDFYHPDGGLTGLQPEDIGVRCMIEHPFMFMFAPFADLSDNAVENLLRALGNWSEDLNSATGGALAVLD